MHKEVLLPEAVEIFPKFKIFDGFCLAGGTALALLLGHRISVDFNFFSEKPISQNLVTDFEKTFPSETISFLVNNNQELTVLVKGVKCTFLHYPFKIINPFVDLEGIKALNILEIAATKAYTIGRRKSYKDYVDLYACMDTAGIKLSDIIFLAQKKYGEVFNGRLFLEQLVYTEDIVYTNIKWLKEQVSTEQMEEYFKKIIKNEGLIGK